MWSHEISQMTGQYTQQALMQGAYANSIGMANPGFAANQLAGTAMSGIAGVGAPVGTAALSMMGMDPFTAGIGAGMAALPTLGVGGAIGAGAAVAAPVAAAWYGGGAVANQVMTGAQQQQNLNMSMRQNFSQFQRGGMGWSNAQLSGLGSQIRAMTHEVGAGGEMHGFNELAGLASNMGRMGFVQTTRDVQQFSQKFRQMVDTLKTVARDLGTSLEAAQEMTAGMRGTGLFQAADQIRMAQMMRGNAVSGNISTQETGTVANIGSQIARAVGGRGRQGAFAGARTIGQIGTAMESGTLTEEDIYNATGQTGAAGRQALATSMMQRSAQFLKTNRGRVMLASLAGENGQLNETAVQQLMAGGMDITGTMQNIGRARRDPANFMRNEGRLRSAVLERFGGNVQTLQLMQWAGQHGIDIESMGDRESIFARRMLGMGQDELEAAVKMARDMKSNARFAEDRQASDRSLQRIRQERRHMGVQGVRNAFNKFRERVQGGLQQVGQELYSAGSNWIERQINEITGMYADTLTEDTLQDFQTYFNQGGRGAAASKAWGRIGMGGLRTREFSEVGVDPERVAAGGARMGQVERYRKFAQGNGVFGMVSRLAGASTLEERTGMKMLPDREWGGWGQMRRAVYGTGGDSRAILDGALSGSAGDALSGLFGSRMEGLLGMGGSIDDDMAQLSARTDEWASFMRGARGPMDKGTLQMAAGMRGRLSTSAIGRLSMARGDERINILAQEVARSGTPEAKRRLAKYMQARSEDRANAGINPMADLSDRREALEGGGRDINALLSQYGLGIKETTTGALGKLTKLRGDSTPQDRLDAYADVLAEGVGGFAEGKGRVGYLEQITKGMTAGAAAGTGGGMLGALPGAVLGGIGGALDAASGGAASRYFGDLFKSDEERRREAGDMTPELARAMAQLSRTKEAKDWMLVATGEDERKKRAFKERTNKLAAKENKTQADHARLQVMKNISLVGSFKTATDAGKNVDEAIKEVAARENLPEDEVKKRIQAQGSVMLSEADMQTLQLAENRAGMASERLDKMYASGMYDPTTGKISKALSTALSKAGAGGAVSAYETRMQAYRTLQQAGGMGSAVGAQATMKEAAAGMARWEDQMAGTSSAAMRKTIAQVQSGEAPKELAQFVPEFSRRLADRRSAALSIGRYGVNVSAAKTMGLRLSRKQTMDLHQAKTPEAFMAQLKTMGYDMSGNEKEIEEAMALMRGEGEVEVGGKKRQATTVDEKRALMARGRDRFRTLGRQAEQDRLIDTKEQRLEEQKMKDPLQASIADALDKMANSLKNLEKDAMDKSGPEKVQKVKIDQDTPIKVSFSSILGGED